MVTGCLDIKTQPLGWCKAHLGGCFSHDVAVSDYVRVRCNRTCGCLPARRPTSELLPRVAANVYGGADGKSHTSRRPVSEAFFPASTGDALPNITRDEAKLIAVGSALADASPFRGREPSLDSPCAVCVAGETRSLALEPVARRFVNTILTPLRADPFLVLSLHTSRRHADGSAASSAFLPEPTAPQLAAMLRILSPVGPSILLDNDASFWMGGEAERSGLIQQFQGGLPPLWGLDVAVRFRVCLHLIERAEETRKRAMRRRGALDHRYGFVVRTRPDVYLPCTLRPLPAHALASPVEPFVAMGNDFVWLMSRSVADVLLRAYPLALHVPYCTDRSNRPEWCVRCALLTYLPTARHLLLQHLSPRNSGPTNAVDLIVGCQLWSEQTWHAHSEPGWNTCGCKTASCFCKRATPRTCKEGMPLTINETDARLCDALDELEESVDTAKPLNRITPTAFVGMCLTPALRWRDTNNQSRFRTCNTLMYTKCSFSTA